eukprot:TRINITY_DN7788_c0_g1_i1.p1 TRINITY_DN7788_c0_g1~~TRINITY_DN7788_c0_g1_i1.p1  ORF type:complete len:438 (-),score=67.88 TRINITY_DN7788_c0_g1_i1:2-1174(-)
MQYLAARCPALEALTLLGTVACLDGSGGTLLTEDLYSVDAPELTDLMGDAALGVVAQMGALRELLISACVEDWVDDEEGALPITPSPSPSTVGAALAHMAPRLRRFGLASCAAPAELLDHLPGTPAGPDGPPPRLVDGRCCRRGRHPRAAPGALPRRPGAPAGPHRPRPHLSPAADFGGTATVDALNDLWSVARLRVGCVGPWATVLLTDVALPALADLRVAAPGGALLGCGAADLRRRCPALAALTVCGAAVDLGWAQGVAAAGVPTVLVGCAVHPRVDHPWLRHERALRFLGCTDDRGGGSSARPCAGEGGGTLRCLRGCVWGSPRLGVGTPTGCVASARSPRAPCPLFRPRRFAFLLPPCALPCHADPQTAARSLKKKTETAKAHRG